MRLVKRGDPPVESRDRHRWQLCVNTWLSGSTHSHGGRSRVGTGCEEEPLICRKPHFYLLRANTTTTIPPPSSFNLCTHTSTSATFTIIIIIHILISSSSSSLLYLFFSATLTVKPRSRKPWAGKRSRDYWARLLEHHSRCNPVLTEVTLQRGSSVVRRKLNGQSTFHLRRTTSQNLMNSLCCCWSRANNDNKRKEFQEHQNLCKQQLLTDKTRNAS